MAEQDLERLVVTLEARIASFEREMKKATGIYDRESRAIEKRQRDLTKRLKAGGIEIGKAIVPTLGIASGAALFKYIDDTVESLDRIGKKSAAIGLTAEQLQILEFAGKRAGLAVEDTDKAVQKFVQNAGKGAAGDKGIIATFKALGVTVDDLRSKSPDALLKQVADGIARVQNPAQRLRLELELFGKGGAGFIDVLKDGAAGLERTAEEARKLGVVFSNEVIAKAEIASDRLSDMKEVLSVQGKVIAVDLLPFVLKLGEALAELAEFAADHPKLIAALSGGGLGAAMGSRFGAPGAAIGAFAGALGGLSAANSEIDALNAKIAAARADVMSKSQGSTPDWIWSERDEAAFQRAQRHLDLLLKQKAKLEAPSPGKPENKNAPVDQSQINLGVTGADAYDKAVAKIQKETAALNAQAGAVDRTTAAMQAASKAAELQAAADTAKIARTPTLTKQINGLADAYGRAAANANVEKIFDAGQKRLDQIKAEDAALGLTVGQAEARKFAEEEINAILRERPITDGDMARIDAQAEELDARITAYEKHMRQVQDAITLSDGVRDSLLDIGTAATHGFGAVEEAVGNALQKIAEMILQMYVLKPLIESVLGDYGTAAGGPGGWGAVASSFASIFAGAFAGGGYGAPNKLALVGEKGPELVNTGPTGLTVTPMSKLTMPQIPNLAGLSGGKERGGGGGLTVNIDATGADAAGLRRVEQAIERLHQSFERRAVSAVQRVIGSGGAPANGFR